MQSLSRPHAYSTIKDPRAECRGVISTLRAKTQLWWTFSPGCGSSIQPMDDVLSKIPVLIQPFRKRLILDWEEPHIPICGYRVESLKVRGKKDKPASFGPQSTRQLADGRGSATQGAQRALSIHLHCGILRPNLNLWKWRTVRLQQQPCGNKPHI